MTTLMVVYLRPKNRRRFDDYYKTTHMPLVRALPGLKGVSLTRPRPTTLAGPEVHLVARLEFADRAAIDAALSSPEGQAAAADTANFADGGLTILAFDEVAIPL